MRRERFQNTCHANKMKNSDIDTWESDGKRALQHLDLVRLPRHRGNAEKRI
ncbi:unnamed protein product, partial [Vitis vinifera]|uniref:Uncharacterized protein n=1 Tax=Vitis vinifera TaxID=29760 RepID=D7UDA6_VITVI